MQEAIGNPGKSSSQQSVYVSIVDILPYTLFYLQNSLMATAWSQVICLRRERLVA